MPDAFHSFFVHLASLAGLGCRYLLVFLVRHWVFGVLNLVLTVVFGLGLLRLISHVGLLRAHSRAYLRLKRGILLCALLKGAFHLVLGDAHGVWGAEVAWGLQLPNLGETLFLARQTSYSLWHPTRITFHVSAILAGTALYLLVRRAWRLRQSSRALEIAVRMHGIAPSAQVQTALVCAAAVIGLRQTVRLPRMTLVPVSKPTPLLLGIRQPRILLSVRLVEALSLAELEMVLRHELAHFRRRDHWWRWLQVWLEDVGRPNVFSGYVGAWVMDQEEMLCDQMAVRSPQDAFLLARALETARRVADEAARAPHTPAQTGRVQVPVKGVMKEASPETAGLPLLTLDLPDSVIPSLLGPHWAREWKPALLSRRLSNLLSLAEEQQLTVRAREKSSKTWQRTLGRLAMRIPQAIVTGLLLLLILMTLCLKFRVMFNLHGLG